MLQFLVVDDDDDVARALAAGLTESCRAAVMRAGDGETATRCLQNQHLDLAVIDVLLPDMSGFALAKRAADRNVPALLMSGHPREQEACRTHEYPHLDKPFALSALTAAAREAVTGARENIARLHKSYARLTATLGQTERVISESQLVREESRRLRATRAAERQSRRPEMLGHAPDKGSRTWALRRAILENIARFQRLLEQEGSSKLNARAERAVRQLLAEEEAKLATLDR